MSILWWEKTVEYLFVQKHVDLKMFVAPLDGDHERGGDAILANESKWVLIEFKRDKNSISDEREKFTNYPNAKEELEPHDVHHVIIYGESSSDNLLLKCQRYFSEKAVAIEIALQSGVDKDSFLNYLQKFVEFKKSSKGGFGGYGFVAGISNDGTVTKCMKLSEFAEVLQLEAALKQKLQQQEHTQQRYLTPGMDR
jgi:hypothetical protein